MPAIAEVAEAKRVYAALKQQMPFINQIRNQNEHEQALALLDELITDDYEANIILIEALSNVIARYENETSEFVAFNQRQETLDPAVALLRVLMDQYNLKTSDFEQEIGKKSMVSQVLSGQKNLTREHISKLSARFNLSPALFF